MRRMTSVFFRKHFGGETNKCSNILVQSINRRRNCCHLHVSGTCFRMPESQSKQLRMFRKNATHFPLKYAPCTWKCVGFSHPKKKTSRDSMVLPNHGHVLFRGLEPPTDADPNLKWDANAYDKFCPWCWGEPTCKAKTIKTAVTIPPQTNSSPLKNGFFEAKLPRSFKHKIPPS